MAVISRHHLLRIAQAVRQKVTGKADDLFDWAPLLCQDSVFWRDAIEAAKDGPRVLIATSMGGYLHGAVVESALAVAMTLRGAKVDIFLCDGVLPGCQSIKITNASADRLANGPPLPRCSSCQELGSKLFAPFGFQIHWYSEMITMEQAATARQQAATIPLCKIRDYCLDGLAVGEHAFAGALRYFARGDLNGEPAGEYVLRRYLEASLLSVQAITGLLQQSSYDVACFHHGLYVPQGLIGEVCRRKGTRVVNWNTAYRKHCFIFSHGDTYHHTMVSEPTIDWENLSWTPELEAKTLGYLKSRWQGTQDWIWFHDTPQEEMSQIATETGIDFSKPCIGMLTNVMWDAQLHYPSNAFPNMLEWVLQTIQYFITRPELQLIIRVHPAEIRGLIPSRQLLVPEIRRFFPALPPNVFVIPPESQISTYVLMKQCNSVIIYNTKTGIEVSSMGIPVIVAGEAWIRGKGFSLDVKSPADYFKILEQLPLPAGLNSSELERARKYAFHFFFRRMIPLPFLKPTVKTQVTIELAGLQQLEPGHFAGLDVICEGILRGTPFIFCAENEPFVREHTGSAQ